MTLWVRVPSGRIRPFDLADRAALFIVSVCSGEHAGQFVFPKDALLRHGFVWRDGVGGKRAIRVYPPWITVPNLQDERSQTWQNEFFIWFGKPGEFDHARVKTLYAPISDNIP